MKKSIVPIFRKVPSSAVLPKTGFPETDRLVAIIGVYAKGFEGLDHRYIAVPLLLKD